ncbi:ankyrin repeat protein [Colletotrichum asianum]|uniref:Ankyrin repeat protein n=1 Tax=Colletotrichum asianum TaxID=702518 RepID=A0A8H3ZNM4_9PEZI|nr:ankyrin repeat protein [Colletotrichum asianum]
MASSNTIAPNLWDIARKRLTNTEEAQLAKAAVDNNTLSQQLLELVQRKQQQCMDRRLKFKRSNGEVVIIRDVFEKVVRWLQRFKEVGDVATQYDPTHAALPWAAVRMLLQIAINDAESLGTIAEGIETVSSLITRCAVLETIHLSPHRYPLSKAHATLQDALVALYTAILSWLSVAGAYYEKHLIKRLLRSIVSSGPTLTSIFQEERKVSQLATSLHDQLASSTAVTVKSLDISFNSLMSMFRDLEQPIARVAGTLDRIERSLEAKERQQLIEWLSVIRHMHVHQTVRRGFIESTGGWLLQKAEYTAWSDSTIPCSLWLRGVPGCGKSKLTSLVVQEHIESVSRTALVAHCYCSRSGIDGNPPSSLVIMGTILRQLAFLVPGGGVHHSAWDEYSQRVKDSEGLEPTPLSLDDCRDLIILITADYPTTIIIDGLDEAEGDIRELLNILQHIIDESQNTVKLFLSSRDSIPVDIHLQNVRSIRVTHVDNAKDVSTFVKSKVGTAVQYKRLLRGKISAEVETRIVRTLTHGSREMFLWASLNLEQLCGSEFEVEADVMDELESLRAPKSLLETLEQMYRRVQQYKPKARQITNIVFGWLLVSERQLSNPELLDIIRLTVNKRLGGVDEENIKSLCRGFVNSENASGSFAFAHESIREFLQGRDDFNATKLQFAAFSSCLRCLTARYDDGERGPLRPDDVVDEMPIDSPNPTPTMDRTEYGSPDVAPACFWQYAIYYWLDHYTKILGQDYRAKADPDLLQFIFEYKGHRFIAWLREMLIVLDEQLKRDDVLSNRTLLLHLSYLESLKAKQQPAIFVASVYGISIILERLEREHTNVDWNEKNIYGTSGLYLSAIRGQDDIVKYLLSHGVDPNMVGGRFKTPIQGAAIRGHASTVEILLNSGADPLLEGRYPTALHAAISGGHEPVIQLLVGNSSCHQAAKLGSLVQAGFYFGRSDAVMSLLRQYFDNEVNSKKFQDEWISIALQAALYGTKNADTNNARIMKLLEEISDINEPGGLFGNALQAASFGGSAAWVHMVLERGADPDSIGYCGSALRAASFGGHNEVVRLLLERGATLGPGNKDALEACALKNRLTNTSEYDECKRHFGAAMRTARRENRYRMVDFMLENGAGFLRRDTLEDVAVGGGGRWGDGGYSPNPVLDIFINDTDNVADRLVGGGK